MINDTGVILNSDHTKWNYDFVVELLEGPLMNARRLDEAIKATKLVRRLFAFFHPYNGRFSAIKRTRVSQTLLRLKKLKKWKLTCTAEPEMGQTRLHAYDYYASQPRGRTVSRRGSLVAATRRLPFQH